MNQLEQLKKLTTVVADTGDFNAIEQYQPVDTTTNPSLLLQAAKTYPDLVAKAVANAKQGGGTTQQQIEDAGDRFAVLVGQQLLNKVPGFNSTEVDARLSFSTEKTINKAQRLIQLYQEQEVDPSRVLVKIAATWEGIQAAKILEQQGIRCNLTLLFSFAQARACAEAGVFLISPFVGRIYDWHKKQQGVDDISIANDPGVQSVKTIFNYYKQHDYATIVMGASFRKVEQVLALAGCDRLTISPNLLQQLAQRNEPVVSALQSNQPTVLPESPLTEAEFRWQFNNDPMATEKTAEGIRQFAADQEQLEAKLKREYWC
ncbi:MAG: transaldolase [Gammaproteobacteria bacterium]|nr:transaldolase [Gammaproteobacteria bacterium]NVK87184.1 transaldolase [Gammaproteobacteria bacterium]